MIIPIIIKGNKSVPEKIAGTDFGDEGVEAQAGKEQAKRTGRKDGRAIAD